MINKDCRLAIRTIAALFHYKIARSWDSFRIALLSVKGLLPPRSRSADQIRGARLGMIAVLGTLAGSRLIDRTGQEAPRP